MRKLVILQTVAPDYRSNLFNHLKTELDSLFVLYSGESYFESSVKSNPDLLFYKKVKNIYLLKRRFLFQFGFWEETIKNNIMVLEMNPRIISNWLILIMRKILKKETILWGHAWPRNGAESKTDTLRGVMRSLADKIIVYTETQKEELKAKMVNADILHAPNSLYFKGEMSVNENIEEIKNIIFVGRLTKLKKPLFLVKAFHSIMDKIPQDCKLIIIGEGEEKNIVLKYINEEKIKSRIEVLGHIGKYGILKTYYDSAFFSISPGYVGLSITQSFSFGVPMIISKTEPHSPEIEAAIENENALFYETDEVVSLGNLIVSVFEQKEIWLKRRQKIMRFCQSKYSIEAMAQSFIFLIKGNEKKRK